MIIAPIREAAESALSGSTLRLPRTSALFTSRVLARAFRFRKERQILPIAFGLQFLDGNKAERRGVDTVTLPRWRGAIFKHMPKVGVAFATNNLGAAHAICVVRFRFDVFL